MRPDVHALLTAEGLTKKSAKRKRKRSEGDEPRKKKKKKAKKSKKKRPEAAVDLAPPADPGFGDNTAGAADDGWHAKGDHLNTGRWSKKEHQLLKEAIEVGPRLAS